MKYISTREKEDKFFSLSDAILLGLAPDGGLFVPESFPLLDNITLSKGLSYAMYLALKPYFEGDELEEELEGICKEAFNFPLSFFKEGEEKLVVELYHGPTSAFKDFGARFLSLCLEKLLKKRGESKTILVATSGDTGSAVASAFYKRENIKVKILFPRNGVTERQRAQLTGWGENISSYAVDGIFDDCQKMVKDAFSDHVLSSSLCSANSINIARLLPQMAYYVYSSELFYTLYDKKPIVIVPSGNMGNATGALWAKKMGSKIERVAIATNSNRTMIDYYNSGEYNPRESIKTLANAMDVGAPSNVERIFALFSSYEDFVKEIDVESVNDEEIQETIKRVYDEMNYIICPHTACAEKMRRDMYSDKPTLVVSTAHPGKFNHVVEPILQKSIPISKEVFEMLGRKDDSKSAGKSYRSIF